ncbi:PREDICTED: uncharacterized protein LOC104763867 [Camelina sativa]|uniref:Uncharacterized protein LOC104763867 n=1 Tax=Camelina sativa TaxID=90675 RepID=A0ABM0XG93_CAMSA|nr:PREDICTED: uncharacterized protein LOC104763867 [Camelina sativa]
MHLPLTSFMTLLLEEVKMVCSFSSVCEDLASTVQALLPVVTEIESMRGVGELKNLKATIDDARVLVEKCSVIKKWDLIDKSVYARRVKNIKEKMFMFCQFQVQLIQLRNQLESMVTMEATKSCMNQQPITNMESKFEAVSAVVGAVGAGVSELLGGVIGNKLNLSHGDFEVNELEPSAAGEAEVSALVLLVIIETKKVFRFKTLSEELASTLEELLRIILEIELLQGVDVEELKKFKDLLNEARVLVQECSEVTSWDILRKAQYTERVDKMNSKMLNFCQIQLQLLLLRNQVKMKCAGIGCP